jgi:hypothetical protein
VLQISRETIVSFLINWSIKTQLFNNFYLHILIKTEMMERIILIFLTFIFSSFI